MVTSDVRRQRGRGGGWHSPRRLGFIRLLTGTRSDPGFYSLGGSGAGLSADDQSESGTARGDDGGGARKLDGAGRGARNLRTAGRSRLPCPPGYAGLRKEKRRGSHTDREAPTQFSRKKTRRSLVKSENQLSGSGRICVGVARWGGTHRADHSLFLNLLGPDGREQAVQAARDSVMIILITTTYCAPTRMPMGLSKPFTLYRSSSSHHLRFRDEETESES